MKFVDKEEASEILSKSPRTLIRYRKQGILIEGIHCAKVGNEWLYNKELIEDLISCGLNNSHPDHQRAIHYYQSQKLGNQLKRKKVERSRSVCEALSPLFRTEPAQK